MTDTQSTSEAVSKYYGLLEREGTGAAGWANYIEPLFDGIALSGRTLLDIGGGDGRVSFYAALHGAVPVCLEPLTDGSSPEMDATYAALAAELDVAVEMRRETFQEATIDRAYDVVVLSSSINHLDEDACSRIGDPDADATYLELFAKLASATAPNGDLVIADAARRNLWGDLKVKNAFAPTIDWSIHQQPKTWVQLLEHAGFDSPRITWRSPQRLGRPGKLLLTNPVGSYLTHSHFVLHMKRGSRTPLAG